MQRGGFAGAGNTVTLNAGLGLGDGQLHGCRNLDGDDLRSVQGNLRRRRLHQVVGNVTQGDRLNVDLLVRVGVHEHEVVAVLVQELHVPTVDDRLFDSHTRVERALDHCTGTDVAQFGAHERATLAGLYVLELHHAEQSLVQFEGDAVLQFVGANCRHEMSFGESVSMSQPVSVTTTRSSIRTPPSPSR